jgi:hypothetical protein
MARRDADGAAVPGERSGAGDRGSAGRYCQRPGMGVSQAGQVERPASRFSSMR